MKFITAAFASVALLTLGVSAQKGRHACSCSIQDDPRQGIAELSFVVCQKVPNARFEESHPKFGPICIVGDRVGKMTGKAFFERQCQIYPANNGFPGRTSTFRCTPL
ncbi:hypothetical protein HGRIS_006645 [Hohenbuehelia grisea]|uniref:Uncharacterized protein n=1 Tax=Hohenbuehelia grisea TaxID=104357 RepID=A0ABR3JA54_9AGAR